MKNSKIKALLIVLILTLGVLSVSFYSCEKEEIVPQDRTAENTIKSTEDPEPAKGYIPIENYCGEIIHSQILNDDEKPVGEAFSYNDMDYYYLLLLAYDGFVMKNCYMHLVNDMDNVPLDEKGNPDFINFQYRITGELVNQRRVFRIPVTALSNNTFITAMAEFRVDKNDNNKYFRAWAGQRRYGNTVLGRVFTHEKGVCLKTAPVQDLVDK